MSDLNRGRGTCTCLGMEVDHSQVGKDVGHHGVLEEAETVKKKVRFTYKIILKSNTK